MTATTVRAQAIPATSERCDRCPATARVRAMLWSGELLFCVHHARKHHERLLDIGATLVLLGARS
jgi:hypothetical protein